MAPSTDTDECESEAEKAAYQIKRKKTSATDDNAQLLSAGYWKMVKSIKQENAELKKARKNQADNAIAAEKAHAAEVEKLNKEHNDKVEELEKAHSEVKAGGEQKHLELLGQNRLEMVNEANELHDAAIAQLRAEHQKEVEAVKSDCLRQKDAELSELKQAAEAKKNELQALVESLEMEKAALAEKNRNIKVGKKRALDIAAELKTEMKFFRKEDQHSKKRVVDLEHKVTQLEAKKQEDAATKKGNACIDRLASRHIQRQLAKDQEENRANREEIAQGRWLQAIQEHMITDLRGENKVLKIDQSCGDLTGSMNKMGVKGGSVARNALPGEKQRLEEKMASSRSAGKSQGIQKASGTAKSSQKNNGNRGTGSKDVAKTPRYVDENKGMSSMFSINQPITAPRTDTEDSDMDAEDTSS